MFDEESTFYYLKTRYNNPTQSRFISTDEVSVLLSSNTTITDKNLCAYCDNNPIIRRDANGAFWETFFDIISLAVSVVEVAANPADPWAWVGLVCDVVDLVPFVTGVGEMARAVKTANAAENVLSIRKAVDFTDDATDLIKGLDRSSGFTKSARGTGASIHKGYKVSEAGKEFRKCPGIRPDCVVLDTANKVIYELKPFNPKSVKQGIKQLEKYRKIMGDEYKMILEVY